MEAAHKHSTHNQARERFYHSSVRKYIWIFYLYFYQQPLLKSPPEIQCSGVGHGILQILQNPMSCRLEQGVEGQEGCTLRDH